MLCPTEALRRLSAILICSALMAGFSTGLRAQSVSVGANDIGGVVTSSNGPEAGVWVIAETTDLPTKFAISFPIFRAPATASGCAAMGWSILPR